MVDDLRAKNGVPKTLVKQNLRLHSPYFPQNKLMSTSLAGNSVICILFLDCALRHCSTAFSCSSFSTNFSSGIVGNNPLIVECECEKIRDALNLQTGFRWARTKSCPVLAYFFSFLARSLFAGHGSLKWQVVDHLEQGIEYWSIRIFMFVLTHPVPR